MKPQEAVADFKRVLALEPGNAKIREELAVTQKFIRIKEFEKVRPKQHGLSKYITHAQQAIGRDEQDAVSRCLTLIAEGRRPT